MSGQGMDSFPSKVVGTTFRGDLPPLAVGQRLSLAWEIGNPHGPRFGAHAQAIAVYAEGQHIGYLRSSGSAAAARVCQHMADARHIGGPCGPLAWAVVTELTGGEPGRENRGINIEITLAPASQPQEVI